MTSLIVKYQRYEHTHTHLNQKKKKKIVISLFSMPEFDLREAPVGDDEQATVLLSCA